jgi:hypothetical protein
MAEKEPQSYGSEGDWSSGKTDQNVNDPKAAPPPQHADFYDERRESESNGEVQGGLVSPVQLADNEPAAPLPDNADGGYFKKRDYE